LAFSYEFDVVKVHMAGGQTRNGWFFSNSDLNGNSGGADSANTRWRRISTFTANANLNVNSYTVGLSAPVGAAGKVMASWMMADPSNSGVRNWGGDKQNVYSLGYSYNLSKRTNVYALGSYADGVNFEDDLKATQFAVGV